MDRTGGRFNLLNQQLPGDCSRDSVFSQRRDTSTRSRPMPAAAPAVSQLSNVITQAMAPAFLLAALAAFIALLIARLNRIVDRTILLHAISDNDAARSRLKTDILRLLRRSIIINC